MKKISFILITTFAIVGNLCAVDWKMGEGSHVVTELPANVKEKMKLKYEKVEARFMKKTVRLTGKVASQKGESCNCCFTVYKKDKKFVSAGQDITAETPIHKDKELKGTVSNVIRKQTNTNKRNYEANVCFSDVDMELQPGTILNGKINFQTPEKVVCVPDGAVHVILHRRCVFVCTGKDGKYELREVETGFKADGYTQIAKGLKAGEEIVTEGSFHLRAELLKPESDFGGHGHAH